MSKLLKVEGVPELVAKEREKAVKDHHKKVMATVKAIEVTHEDPAALKAVKLHHKSVLETLKSLMA